MDEIRLPQSNPRQPTARRGDQPRPRDRELHRGGGVSAGAVVGDRVSSNEPAGARD